MTDSQIVIGIMQNDSRVWRHICRSMKPRFMAMIGRSFPIEKSATIEDIFQDSCVILMQKVKEGQFAVSDEGSLFSYLVRIGRNNALNQSRKKGNLTKQLDEGQEIPQESDHEPGDISLSDKQQTQNEFLDRVFDSIPIECQRMLKMFYWDHKPMDELAAIFGMRNADSAKTKKSRCMQKFRDIANHLVDSEEYAEEAVRAAVERAALRELLNDEKINAETGITTAALDVEDNTDER